MDKIDEIIRQRLLEQAYESAQNDVNNLGDDEFKRAKDKEMYNYWMSMPQRQVDVDLKGLDSSAYGKASGVDFDKLNDLQKNTIILKYDLPWYRQ